MNLVAGLLAVLLCALLGYIFSLKYKERETFYRDFFEFNKIFKNEIDFSKSSLFSIIDGNYKNEGDFYRILKGVVKNKNTFDKNIKYLSKEEISFFENYINRLGTGDVFSQKDFISSASGTIEEKYKISVENAKKYRSFYLKIGILAGLLILVLLL